MFLAFSNANCESTMYGNTCGVAADNSAKSLLLLLLLVSGASFAQHLKSSDLL
jgi:hypothetical protein